MNSRAFVFRQHASILLSTVFSLAFLACSSPTYDSEGFSYHGYVEKGEGFKIALSRDFASLLGTWEDGPNFGLVEGEARADGYLRLKLFAPGTAEASLGTFSGHYARGESGMEGDLRIPGAASSRKAVFANYPGLTRNLAAARLRDSTQTGLPKEVTEPTRFYYLGFEPSSPIAFRTWYRASFQGGVELIAAMKKERDGFFADFSSATAASRNDTAPPKAWYYEGRQFIVWRSPRLLSMGLRLATSTGDPASTGTAFRFALIDERESRIVVPGDLLLPGWEEGIRPLLEEEARKSLGLAPHSSFATAGFFRDALPPSPGYYVYGGGIGFYYNSYELGPSVVGGLWVNLPWPSLGAYLKPGSLTEFGITSGK